MNNTYRQYLELIRGTRRFQTEVLEAAGKMAEIESDLAAKLAREFDGDLILEKDGRQLRAYEDDFLKYVPADAVYLARWAKNEGGYVTVRGRLLDERMELNQLAYKNLIVDTSAIPT